MATLWTDSPDFGRSDVDLIVAHGRGEWLAWLRGVGHATLEPAAEQMFDTVNMCLEAARRGLGVAIADPAMLEGAPESPALVAPFAERVQSGNAYFLTYPPERAEQARSWRSGTGCGA